jgi:DNA-binding winged helix-turn-helix (wHTH) protein/predicted ATPase
LERPGQLVSKEELLRAVWPDVVVTEAVPRLSIRELRQALGDDAQHPQFVETQSRRGYRFIAPLTTTLQLFEGASIEVDLPSAAISAHGPALVARDSELTQLTASLEKALRGQRQMVFVTGEPGIGKTALVGQFLVRATRAHELWITRGQCIEHYGTGEAYLPVLEALERLGRAMDVHALRTILRQQAPTWLVHLSSLIAPLEREELQRPQGGTGPEHVIRELAQALETLSIQRPLVLWLEDLHWSDPSTRALLSAIARRPEPARLLVIATYRPGDRSVGDPRVGEIHHELQLHGYCSELAVPPLSRAAVAEYLVYHFAADPPPDEFLSRLAALIYERTEGNPLFMVTVLRHLITQDVITRRDGDWKLSLPAHILSVTTPPTIRQFLELQLNRLSPADQRLLEIASIAGMQFAAAVLDVGGDEGILGLEERCAALERQGQFVNVRGSVEWPDGTISTLYGFRHALYQAVLYERIPPGRRIHWHLGIGERLERAYSDLTREVAAVLAMHFENGCDRPRAIDYLQQAAENAIRRSAYTEAIGHLTRGLDILKSLPETPRRVEQELRLQLSLGIPLAATRGYAVPEVEHTYRRAHQLCGRIGDTPLLFPALVGIWGFFLVRGDFEPALELASQGLRVAEQTHNASFQLEAHVGLGLLLYYQGNLPAANRHLEEGADLTRRRDEKERFPNFFQDSGVACLTYGALVLWHLGLLDQARCRMAEAIALARRLSHPFSLAFALNHGAGLFMLLRDHQTFHMAIEEATTYALVQGFPLWIGLGTAVGGWEFIEKGQTAEGIARVRQGLNVFAATGTELGKTFFLLLLADAYRKAGHIDQVFATLAETEQIMQKGERLYEPEFYRLKGELSLQAFASRRPAIRDLVPGSGGATAQAQTQAEAAFMKALAVARQQQAKSLALRAAMSLGRLWREQGKARAAHSILMEIYGWFTEGFDSTDLNDAKALLDQLQCAS